MNRPSLGVEMTHIDSRTKCKCGHGREEHSLLDGVFGDGLCGNMRCDCEMFQLPQDEPLLEAAPSQTVAAIPQQPQQEAEAKNALERMAANRYMNWQNAGGPNECKHGYAAGIPCPSCDSETLVSAGIVSKPSPAPPTPAAGKSFEEPKQVESGERLPPLDKQAELWIARAPEETYKAELYCRERQLLAKVQELGILQRTLKFWEESYLAEHGHWGNCKFKEENERLKGLLRELHAMVTGECPSLLDEDSGGNAELDLAIKAAVTGE